MALKRAGLVVAASVLLICTTLAQSPYKLVKTIALAGNGKWDYIKADEKSARLFVSHFDRVHVIDTKTNQEIKSINNLQGVHGIALAPEFNKGFITNGKDNTIFVFDYTTLDSLTTIKAAGEKPDAILYDPSSKTVWAFCGNTNNATVIDAATSRVVKTVAVGEVPEFAVTNNKGLIYNNLEDGNEVAVINTAKQKTIKTFALHDKAAPTGLAIDLAKNVLFSACAVTKKLVILDAATGKQLAVFPISDRVDAVAFDPVRKLIFCSGGDGIITVIKQLSKTKYSTSDAITTRPGAKTMAVDAASHKVYTSTALYEADGKTLVKDSFSLLVFED